MLPFQAALRLRVTVDFWNADCSDPVDVVTAAGDALSAGLSSPSLPMLAGLPPHDCAAEVADLAPVAMAELGMDLPPRNSVEAELACVTGLSRGCLEGEVTPAELAYEVERAFGRALPVVGRMGDLVTEYEIARHFGSPLAELDRKVLAEARMLAEASPDPLRHDGAPNEAGRADGAPEFAKTDDGCQLWTRAVGDGPPVVLCHGGPGIWDTFTDLAALLSPHLRVIRWDQRGCGLSTHDGPYTMDRFVADLDAIRQHHGLDRVNLLGHSFGAALALRYAMANPDRVDRLVYVSGTGVDADRPWRDAYERHLARALGDYLPRWEWLSEASRGTAQEQEMAVLRWSADFADPDRAIALAWRMANPWLGVNYACNSALGADYAEYLRETDVLDQCRALSVPTLIIDGRGDIRPRSSVDTLDQALPWTRRVMLADAGHLPWVERPGSFVAATTEFFGIR